MQSSTDLKVYNDHMSHLELLKFTLMQGYKFETYGISSIRVTLDGVSCSNGESFHRHRGCFAQIETFLNQLLGNLGVFFYH